MATNKRATKPMVRVVVNSRVRLTEISFTIAGEPYSADKEFFRSKKKGGLSRVSMSDGLHLTEGAAVLDVYDHEKTNDQSMGYEEEEDSMEDEFEENEGDANLEEKEEEEEPPTAVESGRAALAALAEAQQAPQDIENQVFSYLLTKKRQDPTARKMPSPPTTPMHASIQLPPPPSLKEAADEGDSMRDEYFSFLLNEPVEVVSAQPTSFSSHDRHYEGPPVPAFPEAGTPGEESLMAAAFLAPPSPTPPTKSATLSDAFSTANKVLGGEDAVRWIDETIEAAALRIKVQMLREQARGLKSTVLVDMVFGTDDAPRKPTSKEIDRLKNTIAVELTTNEFTRCSKVSDVDSAELFRRTNDNLELMQRQQIMSNPLFADAAIFKTRHAPTSTPAGKSLHHELLRIMSGKEDPSQKLADRLNFLKKLIRFKTASVVSWTRLINLLAGVSSQAAVVLFGDYEEEQSADGSMTDVGLQNANMGSLGVDLLFGAATDIVERNMSRVCTDVGELALYLNIPVVLLPWPAEFVRSSDYKTLLMSSISSFSAKVAIPPMYVLDQIIFDDDEGDVRDEAAHTHDIFSKTDKKDAINRVYNNFRRGGKERDLMRNIFDGPLPSLGDDDPDPGAAYTAAASVINYNMPMFESVMNGVVQYLDKRKHLITNMVARLLKKARLAATVYCINNRLSGPDEEDAPMPNLMYRTAVAPRIFTAQSAQPPAAPGSLKRPSHNLLANRVKRLRALDMLSDDDEISDDDRDP